MIMHQGGFEPYSWSLLATEHTSKMVILFLNIPHKYQRIITMQLIKSLKVNERRINKTNSFILKILQSSSIDCLRNFFLYQKINQSHLSKRRSTE